MSSNTPADNTQKAADATKDLVNNAAEAAKEGVNATRKVASEAVDKAQEGLEAAQKQDKRGDDGQQLAAAEDAGDAAQFGRRGGSGRRDGSGRRHIDGRRWALQARNHGRRRGRSRSRAHAAGGDQAGGVFLRRIAQALVGTALSAGFQREGAAGLDRNRDGDAAVIGLDVLVERFVELDFAGRDSRCAEGGAFTQASAQQCANMP